MKRRSIKKTEKTGVIKQMYIIVIAALIIVGVITYFTQYALSTKSVEESIAKNASNIATQLTYKVREYPASEWLLRYWYEHADELDIEYDVDYVTGVKTEEKTALLNQHHPDFLPEYATVEEVESLPEEDQKLYAEIIYTWLTNDINQIKRSNGLDFLFILVTDEDGGENPYKYQFFLLSGSDYGAKRGTKYLEVYPLGHVVSTEENVSQQEVMRAAVERSNNEPAADGKAELQSFARAGDYADYYEYLGEIDSKAVLIGLTYDMSGILGNIRRLTLSGTLYAVLYQYILLQLIMVFLYFFGLSPMKKILGHIRTYAKTKNSEELTDNLLAVRDGRGGFAIRRNEIGELSEDMISLAEEIDEYTEQIEKITAEKERIGAELTVAAQIQSAMLPSIFPPFPNRKEFDLYAAMDPAREVGGDFYDFFMIDEDHLAIVIADVSGKGIPAALFMMASQIVLHNMANMYKSPAKVLEVSNNEICQHNLGEMFITVWLGVLEISTGKLTAANAGHEYPAICSSDGTFELLKDKHGFVIGGMTDMKYKEYELYLKPGMKLFVYTDGVAEANNKDKDLFGTERMIAALNEDSGAGPVQILSNVRKAVDEFVGDEEQFDDLTMLCLDYKGVPEDK